MHRVVCMHRVLHMCWVVRLYMVVRLYIVAHMYRVVHVCVRMHMLSMAYAARSIQWHSLTVLPLHSYTWILYSKPFKEVLNKRIRMVIAGMDGIHSLLGFRGRNGSLLC